MSFTRDEKHVEVLKRTKNVIGYLHPVVVDEDSGVILSGRHRKFADDDWPEIKIKVKDELHKELIILLGNVQRQPKEEETRQRLIRIAKILESQGIPKKEVSTEMSKLLEGIYSQAHIIHLLPKEYKVETKPKGDCNATISHAEQEAKRQVHEMRTALNDLSTTLTGEPAYPYPECTCKHCMHRGDCY